jgi:hypothetical protein
MLGVALERGLIDEATAEQKPPPCSSGLIVNEGEADPDPIAVIVTRFTTSKVTLAEITRFLDPANWPQCCDLWCTMNELLPPAEPGVRCYLEEISFQCGQPNRWRLEIPLMFLHSTLDAHTLAVQYKLCTHPQHQPPRPVPVDVDEGVFWASDAGGDLSVEVTKRVRFTGTFEGPGLAMTLCALGYGPGAEHMALTCALEHIGGSDTPWTTGDRTVQGGDSKRDMVSDVVDGLVSATTGCLDEAAAALRASLQKASAGMYGPDDLARDIAEMWTRAARHAGRALASGGRGTGG